MSAVEPPRMPLFAALPRRARCGHATLEFAVLGSSSSGNASVLRVTTRESRRQILLDAGLSPRATFGAMRALGFALRGRSDLIERDYGPKGTREELQEELADIESRGAAASAGVLR